MEIYKSTIAYTIHHVSAYFGLKSDSEQQLLKCFNNLTDCRRNKLEDRLEDLLLKIKSHDKSQHKTFWKTVTDVIENAKLFMPSGFNFTIKQPPVTKSLRKTEGYKYVRLVLERTQLKCPVPFWFAVPEISDRMVLKVGEGSFADVYQIKKNNDEYRILKIIPVGEEIPNSECDQPNFRDITAEVYVSQELSKLPNHEDYSCSTFPNIYKVSVIQDDFPEAATRAWNSYFERTRNTSSHPCPNVYSSDQAYIAIETEIAGIDLESFKIEKFSIALSIFEQVATGLAVAEKKLLFEHRDLHSGNILLKPYAGDTLPVILDSKTHSIRTYGVKASIIDFTYSRITTDVGTKYLDLSEYFDPEEKFRKRLLDHRYVYSKMTELTESNWKVFCPKTNILWLKHVLEHVLLKMEVQKTRPSDRLENMARICLNIHNQTILHYSSAFEFVV